MLFNVKKNALKFCAHDFCLADIIHPENELPECVMRLEVTF